MENIWTDLESIGEGVDGLAVSRSTKADELFNGMEEKLGEANWTKPPRAAFMQELGTWFEEHGGYTRPPWHAFDLTLRDGAASLPEAVRNSVVPGMQVQVLDPTQSQQVNDTFLANAAVAVQQLHGGEFYMSILRILSYTEVFRSRAPL